MRFLRVVGLWLTTLLTSSFTGFILFVATQQLLRAPGLSHALLGGLIPITTLKWPWGVIILVTAITLGVALRRSKGPRSVGWALWGWLLRLGLSWSVTALLVLVSVIIYGLQSRSLADLNLAFALGSIGTAAAVFVSCALGWSRIGAATDIASND